MPDPNPAIDITNGMYGLPAGAFSLEGKTAVITGASRNIGLSLALGCAQAGANVVMIARDGERLRRAAEAVRAAVPGRTIHPLQADISVRADTDRVSAYVSEAGGADVLINNARANGTDRLPRPASILDIRDESWGSTFQTNVMGAYRLIRGLFSGHLATGRAGSIINVLSGSGFQLVPTFSSCPYGASKSAVSMMTRYLATHLVTLQTLRRPSAKPIK